MEMYCERFSSKESELLHDLNRQSHLQTTAGRMVSGALQGRFLAMISQMIQPKTILEIGTFTGYSALCLAEGLQKDGELITIDINEETMAMAKEYFESSTYSAQINPILGQALDVIPTLPHSFDLVFIDADKGNYPHYFDAIIDRMNPGGIILADNVLWNGKVSQKESEMDKKTKQIHDFNKKINSDPRVENVLMPLRDGIMMIRKL